MRAGTIGAGFSRRCGARPAAIVEVSPLKNATSAGAKHHRISRNTVALQHPRPALRAATPAFPPSSQRGKGCPMDPMMWV